RLIERLRIVGFEKSEHLLARKFRIDRQLPIGKFDQRIDAARALTARRRLQVVHMPREKILEQSLEALLAEASAQMRHLEQIVEVVYRGADHAKIFQLLLRFI